MSGASAAPGAGAIDAAGLLAALRDGGEIALLDVREQGVHYKGHPFWASCLPLSRLELMADDLVPRRDVRMVLFDDGAGPDLAGLAQRRLAAFGYTNVRVLAGGLAAWRDAGYEVFSGVNVPSKAFGEFVEHRYDTPRIPPERLKALKDSGRKMVILDSRPYDEFHRMSIPGGVDAPGAELVWRVHDLAPDPDTLVVVNCAGRTRSIIGAQSLINAGIPNEVVALKDGTMGWDLAGFDCARGATTLAPAPSPSGRAKALAAAERVAARFGVRFVDGAAARALVEEKRRTTYLLDVRSPAEFEAGHIAGSRPAPGGQLVQATDEYVGVRGARLVLIDPERVRAVMTASWLLQLGWRDVFVLEGGFDGWPVASGRHAPRRLGFAPAPTISPAALAERLAAPAPPVVLDFATSLRYRDRHVPGAWWAVRARLAIARGKLGAPAAIVLASEDGVLAHYAAADARDLWPGAEIRVLDGGSAAWFAAGLPAETGMTRPTTTLDDVWYKPYDFASDYAQHARDYLSWEVALVEQIKRDPTIQFKDFG
jgi:rhodanese-related sulfurtransferase